MVMAYAFDVFNGTLRAPWGDHISRNGGRCGDLRCLWNLGGRVADWFRCEIVLLGKPWGNDLLKPKCIVIIVIIFFFCPKTNRWGSLFFRQTQMLMGKRNSGIYSCLHYLVDGNAVVSPEGQPSLNNIVCYDRFNWINCSCSIQFHRTRQVVAIWLGGRARPWKQEVVTFKSTLVGGLEPWNLMTFLSYWECHHPNWLIFFRGVGLNHQAVLQGHATVLGDSRKVFQLKSLAIFSVAWG